MLEDSHGYERSQVIEETAFIERTWAKWTDMIMTGLVRTLCNGQTFLLLPSFLPIPFLFCDVHGLYIPVHESTITECAPEVPAFNIAGPTLISAESLDEDWKGTMMGGSRLGTLARSCDKAFHACQRVVSN